MSEMDIQFNKDHYRTPKYVFNWLDRRFYFLIDGCASEHNALCSTYIGDGINAAAPDFLTFEPLEQVIETA
ncbi:phage N-6-adenine-methyltransferase, partial [Pasteurella multocida]|nr:phage N-6-adenine-methyltransferase [Pasteurella multocida]